MSARKETRVAIAILGAGPTGIGAAWRLSQKSTVKASGGTHAGGLQPFLLIDESTVPGGRAASFTTPEGFIFDHGGHVLFPHTECAEFIALLEKVVPEWHWSTPIRGVWIANRFIPTPVQRNIHRLPLPALIECLWGLLRRSPNEVKGAELSLQDYLEQQFGEPLTRHVMAPLNRKMWAHDPRVIGSAWSSHRSGSKERNIPEVSVRAVLRNLVLNRDEAGWTESTTVRYPRRGGMGIIWQRMVALLPGDSQRLGSRVCRLDAGKKRLWLADGSTIQYERLVSSIPIDVMLRIMQDQPGLQARSKEFRAARVQLVGFGLLGAPPEVLKDVHVVNLPEPHVHFWRVNVPSNFSPGNIPDPATMWSILCESSLNPDSETRYEPDQIEAALRQMAVSVNWWKSSVASASGVMM